MADREQFLRCYDTTITDVVIMFTGYNAPWNAEIPVDDDPSASGGTDVSDLIRSVRRLPRLPNRRTLVFGRYSALTQQTNAHNALDFYRSHFHPLGKLIVYGFSAGGTDALAFTRAVQNYARYHQHVRNIYTPASVTEREGFVRVDNLITIDAAHGWVVNNRLDRTVPACVRKNLNFYQDDPNILGSHGAPNTALNTGCTEIENRRLQGSSHTDIDNHTFPFVLSRIGQMLLEDNTPTGSMSAGAIPTAPSKQHSSRRIPGNGGAKRVHGPCGRCV